MVSGTRCPASSVEVMRLGESRAVASKGQCPTEHRGEPLHHSRPQRDDFRSERAELRLGRANFRSGMADLRPVRGNFRPVKTSF